MKLIIAGSRSFCCTKEGHSARPFVGCFECTDLARKIWRVMFMYTDFLNDEYRPLEIVSGCAKGADKLGELFAERMKFPVKQFPAKWRVGGAVNMKAGFERNEEMCRYSEAALVLFDGQSSGSRDMIKRMKAAKKPCVVYNFVSGKIE